VAQKGAPTRLPIAIDLGDSLVESGSFPRRRSGPTSCCRASRRTDPRSTIRAAARLGRKVQEALACSTGCQGRQEPAGETAPLRAWRWSDSQAGGAERPIVPQ